MVCFAMPMGVGSCGADDAGKLFEADRVPASGAYGGQGGSGGVGGRIYGRAGSQRRHRRDGRVSGAEGQPGQAHKGLRWSYGRNRCGKRLAVPRAEQVQKAVLAVPRAEQAVPQAEPGARLVEQAVPQAEPGARLVEQAVPQAEPGRDWWNRRCHRRNRGATGGTGGATGGSGGSGGCTAVGHDEDFDLVDDGCDNCPSFANQSQKDTDGDGLGDACEWHNNSDALSKVMYFEPFFESGWASSWDLNSSYKVGTDVLNVNNENCSSGNCGKNSYWKTEISGLTPYAVETSLLYGSGSFGWAGVLLGESPGQNKWWGCFLDREQYSRTLELWENTGSSLVRRQWKTSVENTSTGSSVQRWLRAYWNGSSITCEYRNGNGAVAQTQPYSVSGTMTGRAGVRVYSVNAEFHSFTVYR